MSRNLQFAKQPTIQIIEEKVSETVKDDRAKEISDKVEKLKNRKKTQLPDLNVDKILSPTELLDQKLKSGEITKYCI